MMQAQSDRVFLLPIFVLLTEFFDNEVAKLDKWAEDMKKVLELDLKKLDVDIKIFKTSAK